MGDFMLDGRPLLEAVPLAAVLLGHRQAVSALHGKGFVKPGRKFLGPVFLAPILVAEVITQRPKFVANEALLFIQSDVIFNFYSLD
jgi:hypothetical protein